MKNLSVKMIVAIVLCGIATTAAFAQEKNNSKIRVACVGDSITRGNTTDAYPAVLGSMLGDGYEVVNFGFGARTLLNKGDHPYMKEQMFQDALTFNPDFVIIKFGTNDSKPQNWAYRDEFAGDLKTMIEAFEKLPSSPKIFVCYPATAYEIKWGINDSTIVNDVIPIIGKVAKEKAVDVIDMHTATRGVNPLFPDNIHPSAQGAVLLAAEAYRAIMGTK